VYAVQSVDAFDDVRQHQFSQEVQLVGSTDQLTYAAGLYYFKEHVNDDRDTGFTGIYTDPTELNYVGTNPFEFGGENRQTAQTTSYAAYSQATFTPSFVDAKRLHLTAGLRYTSDKKEFNRTLEASAPVNRTPPPFQAKRVDPAFVVAWDWAQDINTYLRFAQAYRSGGYDLGSPTLDPYQSEVNKSLELGLKSLLDDHKVRLNMAAFYSRISNYQTPVQIDPTNPNIVITINAPGITTIAGIENEVDWEPLPGLTVTGSYAYQNGRLPVGALHAIDPDGVYHLFDLPRHKVGAGLDYSSHVLPVGVLVFHLEYAWTNPYIPSGGGRDTLEASSALIRRDVAGARITLDDLDWGSAHMKVAVFADNLFNKSYGNYAPIFGTVHLAPPRVVGVTLTADFH
jgi:iron complex outermembrane receptor protein